MSPKASETGFFNTLGKDDDSDEDVPRRRRKTAQAPEAAQDAPAQDTEPDTTGADQAIPGVPEGPRRRRKRPEPVHKVSVDILWSLVDGLTELYERDKRGPKAEFNHAIRAHLKKKNINVEPWEG